MGWFQGKNPTVKKAVLFFTMKLTGYGEASWMTPGRHERKILKRSSFKSGAESPAWKTTRHIFIAILVCIRRVIRHSAQFRTLYIKLVFSLLLFLPNHEFLRGFIYAQFLAESFRSLTDPLFIRLPCTINRPLIQNCVSWSANQGPIIGFYRIWSIGDQVY